MLPNGLKLGILAIFVVICFSNSLLSTSFSEEEKIKWIIEDQQITSESIVKQHTTTKADNSDAVNIFKNIFDGKNFDTVKSEQTVELELSILKLHEGDFFSGNTYTKDGEDISSASLEGQSINELLLKQKEVMRENWLHKIKYHDRYDDGYIELAQAMLDPVGNPDYIINGKKFDTNPDSNLEYYLRERGFDPNNPESIPNYVFNPAKYVDARQILKSDGHYKGTDLTQVNDYYKSFSKEDIQAYLIEEIEKHTTLLRDDLNQEIFTSLALQNPQDAEKTNAAIQYSSKATVNRISDSMFSESIGGGDIFQNTKHIIQSPDVSITSELEPDYELISILGIIITTIFLAIMGYTILKKRLLLHENQVLLPEIIPEVNVIQITLDMVEESLKLLRGSKKKEAHEKLSQAIRYYYSNKIGSGSELNSSELIHLMKKRKLTHSRKIKNWLEFCGMVEFAKHDINEIKFHNIISSFKRELK